ncbi:MAG: exo-alpha-sialidase [Siphonobacter aquaeclarae]|nr:exo-alpha-sialidase [Siphonobacter aquaeclarae]
MKIQLLGLMLSVAVTGASASGIGGDTTRTYAIPTVSLTPKGTVALSWTEKDDRNIVHYYWAESKDQGRTFGEKKQIFESPGMSGSRLMRPKLLFKKDGTWATVFALRGDVPAAAASTGGHEHHHGGEAPKAPSGRPSDLQIVFSLSKDQGKTWSVPAPVHADRTPKVVRGFFDATVLANGEIGVAYLRDIDGRPHERDLRFVTSSGDTFGSETVLDPFVCDCCNISLLVDDKGILNLYYRENQENIRDIAKMTSSDNGKTFSKPQILFADNWKINGCPHSGPTSAAGPGGNVISWFSGTAESPGIRLVTQEGKRLLVIADASAKNMYLAAGSKSAALLWEQQGTESDQTVLAYRTVKKDGVSEAKVLGKTANGTNASGVIAGNRLVVAYEVKNSRNKNTLAFESVEL